MMEQKNQQASGEKLKGEKYLAFNLGNKEMVIPLPYVREVVAVTEFTTVPNSPDYLLGVMNLRGQVISVINLGQKLKIREKSEEPEPAVIIVECNDYLLGMKVDATNNVISIVRDEVQDSSGLAAQMDCPFLDGLVLREKQMILILNTLKIIDSHKKNKSTQR